MRTNKRSIQQTYLKKPSGRLSSFRHHLPSSFLAFSIIVNPLSPTNSLSKTFFQKPLTLKPRKESTSMPSSSPLKFSLFFLSFFFSFTVLFLLPTATWKASYSPQKPSYWISLFSQLSPFYLKLSPKNLPTKYFFFHSLSFFFFQNLHSTHSLKSRKISRLSSSAHSSQLSLSLKMAFSKQLPHPLTLVHSFFFFLSAPATWIFSALHLKWPAVHLLSNKPKKKPPVSLLRVTTVENIPPLS